MKLSQRWSYGPLIVSGCYYVVASIICELLYLSLGISNIITQTILFQFITFLPIYLYLESIANAYNKDRKYIRIDVKTLFSLFFATLLISSFSNQLSRLLFEPIDIPEAIESQLKTLAAFLSIVIIGPILEELVFRKSLFTYLEGFLNKNIAISVTTILFCLIHGPPNYIVATLGLSASLTYIYYHTRNIRLVIIIHSSLNFMGWFLMSRDGLDSITPPSDQVTQNAIATVMTIGLLFLGVKLIRNKISHIQ